MSAGELTVAAKERALAHGFDLAAVAPPGLGEAHGRYMAWIKRGYAGEMSYLSRNPYVRGDLRRLWPETRAALVVAMQYRPERETPHAAGQGKIARYAHGGDYHKFMKKRLIRVLRDLKEIDPGVEGRSYVDTGPPARARPRRPGGPRLEGEELAPPLAPSGELFLLRMLAPEPRAGGGRALL